MCRIEIKHYIHPGDRRETVEVPYYCQLSDGRRFCHNTQRIDMGNIIIRSTNTSGAPSPVSLVRDAWPSPPSSNQPGTPVSATSANYEIRSPLSRGNSQLGKKKERSDRASVDIGRRDSKRGGKYFKRRSTLGQSSSEEDVVRLDAPSYPSGRTSGPGLYGPVPTPPPPPPHSMGGGVTYQQPESPTSRLRRRPQSVEVHNNAYDPIVSIIDEKGSDNEFQLRQAAREHYRKEERERRRKEDEERRKREKEEREEEAARLDNARIDAREAIRAETRARREKEERQRKEKEDREHRRQLEEVERELSELRRKQRDAEREKEKKEKEAAENRARVAEQLAIEAEIDRLNRRQKVDDERRRMKRKDEDRKRKEDEYQKWIERQEFEAKAAMDRASELESEIRELRAERERRTALDEHIRLQREINELESDLGSNVASVGPRPSSRPTSQRGGYGYVTGGAFQPSSYGSSSTGGYSTSPIATRAYSPTASRPYSPTGPPPMPSPYGYPAPMPPQPSSPSRYPASGFFSPFPALPAAPQYTSPPAAYGELTVQTRPRNVSDEEWRRQRGQQVLAQERAKQRTKDLEDALRRGGGYQ